MATRFPSILVFILLAAGCSASHVLLPSPQPSPVVEEKNRVMEQEYIDPLTDFIRKYETSPEYEKIVQEVRIERTKRCQEIYEIYLKRPTTEANLQRLKRNYSYSCPQIIAKYIENVTIEMPRDDMPTPQLTPGETCQRSFKKGQYLITIEQCTELATAGDADAQYYLAQSYRQLNRNAEAFFWAEKATRSGDARSQFLQGDLFAKGYGVKKDDRKAFLWKEKAAIQGLDSAQLDIAESYMLGQGTKANAQMAKFWYLSAANQGNVRAQLQLADLFASDKLGRKDIQSALIWYNKAAQQGDSYALFSIGKIYADPQNNEYNPKLAYEYFEKSYLAGNQRSVVEMGKLKSVSSPPK